MQQQTITMKYFPLLVMLSLTEATRNDIHLMHNFVSFPNP